jgi:hypothetical protein
MKSFLPVLLCALISNALAVGQDQPETPRPVGQGRGRGGPPSRPEPPPAGRQVVLDILIADLTEGVENPTSAKILELEKAGKLAAATRLKLTTLDELPGFVQSGGRIAVKTSPGGDRGGFGSGPRPTPTSDGGGLILQATTRMEESGTIVMQIYLERPETAVPLALAGDGSRQARIDFSFLTQNTVRLRSSEPVLISGRQSSAGADKSQTWAVVTATVGH